MSGTYQKLAGKIQCGTGQPLVLKVGLPIALIIVGIVAYANSFRVPFIFDDAPNIQENAHIRSLWPLTKVMSPPVRSGLWGRPILSFSLVLNYAFSEYKVWGYHAFNLAVHILAGLTLYGIVRRTLLCERLKQRFGKYTAVLAWVVATIWLVHPVQTESVTYIIQRAESLMGFFYLLTLYLAIRAMESDKPLLWSVLSVVCCGLGMGTKEVMVTAPALVLLYDRMFAAGSFIAALRRRWFLYLGLAATWGILAGLMWSGPYSKTVGFSIGISSLDYALNQCIVILHYLRLCVWPAGLCLDYIWPVTRNWVRILPFMLLILSMGAVTVWGLIRNRIWSYPAAWFFVVLAPTSSFVPIADLAFEHRMYLPLAGVVVLVVLGGYVFLERLSAKRAGLVSAVVVISVLVVVTFQRNNDYRSAISIWQSVVDIEPANPRAHNNLGLALQLEGKFDDAAGHFREAQRVNPYYAEAYNNLGLALRLQGRFEEAIEQFLLALRPDPDYAGAHNNLGVTYVDLGRYDEAIKSCRQAIRIKPDYADAYYNLGLAFKAQGNSDEAINNFRQAIKIKPDYTVVYNELAGMLIRGGKFDEAVNYYRRAIQIKPDYAEAHYNLGTAFASQGKFSEAAECFQQALRIRPDYAEAHSNLGAVLKSQGRLDEAIEHYREALKKKPDAPEIHNNLGNALLAQGRTDEAIDHFRQAVKLKPDFAEAYFNLGRAFQSQARAGDAENCYRQALQINPNHTASGEALQKLLGNTK